MHRVVHLLSRPVDTSRDAGGLERLGIVPKILSRGRPKVAVESIRCPPASTAPPLLNALRVDRRRPAASSTAERLVYRPVCRVSAPDRAEPERARMPTTIARRATRRLITHLSRLGGDRCPRALTGSIDIVCCPPLQVKLPPPQRPPPVDSSPCPGSESPPCPADPGAMWGVW